MYGRLVDGDSTWEDETFSPDVVLKDLDKIETEEYILEAIHTPWTRIKSFLLFNKKFKLSNNW
jgi:hypothetical protein